MTSRVQWIDEMQFAAGGTRFLTLGDRGDDVRALELLTSFESTVERFVMLKPRSLVERYIDLVDKLAVRGILELGIAQGGSTAFFAAVAEPDVLVAIEIEPTPVPALTEFIERNGMREAVCPHYGVDQADVAALEGICDEAFADRTLDLVIDDASHLLAPTRASFNALFRRLRPGGVYVIEDWSWAGTGDESSTQLVFDLAMCCAAHRGFVERVEVEPTVVYVTRGPDPVPRAFDVAAPRRSVTPDGGS